MAILDNDTAANAPHACIITKRIKEVVIILRQNTTGSTH